MSKPKISVNKLGEYIGANPLRRKRIVEQQKDPSAFIVTRYSEAREAYINFVISKFDSKIIQEAISSINNKPNSTDFQANDKSTSLESLTHFDKIPFPNELLNFEITPFTGDGKMDISGVVVNVNPDLIFRGIHKNKNIIGAIKFSITKTTTLNDEARKNVATVLHQFVEERLKNDNEIAPFNFCFSIDVFSNNCENAPSSYKNRRNQINASCEEYSLWWSKLE